MKLLVLSLLSLHLTVAVFSPGVVSASEEPLSAMEHADQADLTNSEREAALREEILEALRRNESVLPPQADGHPVASMYNREAVVPPQCYTKTEAFFNPCYVCHQDGLKGRENLMNDRDLQVEYSFSDLGMTNHWKNLFEDRSDVVAGISDEAIVEYVREDNYSELADRLEYVGFKGWIPDLKNLQLGAEAFDEEGFAKDGSQWVAFNYKPMPSTFWPANGSTDDVMIRLPDKFARTADGEYSLDVYKANLAIVEAVVKGLDRITSLPVDEKQIGVDLDQNGSIEVTEEITVVDAYVGAAADERIERHLYPQGTEFLHTVRYVDFGEDGAVTVSKRMKEVRYMKKWVAYSKPVYGRQYQLEAYAKEAGNLPGYHYLGDYGLDNGNGWAIQGFIEDAKGRLRVSTYEENFFCMGCHNSVGSSIDKTFSFPRKIDGAAGWGYINLKGMPDAPNVGETRGEYATYLERVGGGSEFRNNDELFERWFHADGTLNVEKVLAARDVHELITPSRERALLLNKAYRAIVMDQDYIYGRDATVEPPANVYPSIDNETSPTLPEERTFDWNILLDWSQANVSE